MHIHSSFNKTFNNFVDICAINALCVRDLYSDIRLTSGGQGANSQPWHRLPHLKSSAFHPSWIARQLHWFFIIARVCFFFFFSSWVWCLQWRVKVLIVCTRFSCELWSVFLFPTGPRKAQGSLLFIDSEHGAGMSAHTFCGTSGISTAKLLHVFVANQLQKDKCKWKHQVHGNTVLVKLVKSK